MIEHYLAECVDLGNGVRFLQIDPPIDRDEKRFPGPLQNPNLTPKGIGLANLDVVLAQGDLLFLIGRRLEHHG